MVLRLSNHQPSCIYTQYIFRSLIEPSIGGLTLLLRTCFLLQLGCCPNSEHENYCLATPLQPTNIMALFINDRYAVPSSCIYFTPAPSASPASPAPSDISRSTQPAARTSALNRTSLHTSTPNQISTPTPPPKATPTPCDDEIVKRILKELANNNDRRVQIPGVDEGLYDRIKKRTDALSERPRYYYDFNSCSIIIDTLPSDIHESIQEYLTDSLKYSLRRWVARFFAHAKVKITGSIDRDLFSADGGRLKGKTPDQGFRVIIPGLEPRHYPNIIVEVGYSESHPDLVSDARRWLTEARDDPVLCALIIIFRKPSQSSNFTDLSKWKASLEVYERYVD